jgi:phosphoglycolate phosphatase
MEESVIEQCPVLTQTGGMLYGDVVGVLERLGKRVPVFIVSNCRGGYIEAFMEAHGVRHLITDLECPGYSGKLKADNIRLVAERNHLKNPLYVGDTHGDGVAAREAGVQFCFARYGFGDTDVYDYVIDDICELESMI